MQRQRSEFVQMNYDPYIIITINSMIYNRVRDSAKLSYLKVFSSEFL